MPFPRASLADRTSTPGPLELLVSPDHFQVDAPLLNDIQACGLMEAFKKERLGLAQTLDRLLRSVLGERQFVSNEENLSSHSPETKLACSRFATIVWPEFLEKYRIKCEVLKKRVKVKVKRQGKEREKEMKKEDGVGEDDTKEGKQESKSSSSNRKKKKKKANRGWGDEDGEHVTIPSAAAILRCAALASSSSAVVAASSPSKDDWDITKRSTFGVKAAKVCEQWFVDNVMDPYPSDGVKADLARKARVAYDQVSSWFINTRMRKWNRILDDVRAGRLKQSDGVSNSEALDEEIDELKMNTKKGERTAAKGSKKKKKSSARRKEEEYDSEDEEEEEEEEYEGESDIDDEATISDNPDIYDEEEDDNEEAATLPKGKVEPIEAAADIEVYQATTTVTSRRVVAAPNQQQQQSAKKPSVKKKAPPSSQKKKAQSLSKTKVSVATATSESKKQQEELDDIVVKVEPIDDSMGVYNEALPLNHPSAAEVLPPFHLSMTLVSDTVMNDSSSIAMLGGSSMCGGMMAEMMSSQSISIPILPPMVSTTTSPNWNSIQRHLPMPPLNGTMIMSASPSLHPLSGSPPRASRSLVFSHSIGNGALRTGNDAMMQISASNSLAGTMNFQPGATSAMQLHPQQHLQGGGSQFLSPSLSSSPRSLSSTVVPTFLPVRNESAMVTPQFFPQDATLSLSPLVSSSTAAAAGTRTKPSSIDLGPTFNVVERSESNSVVQVVSPTPGFSAFAPPTEK